MNQNRAIQFKDNYFASTDFFPQLVLTNQSESQIDLSRLNNGMYFCRIWFENNDWGSVKVLKQ